MPKNLLLSYSEELASKCEALCRSIKGNANAVFGAKSAYFEAYCRL